MTLNRPFVAAALAAFAVVCTAQAPAASPAKAELVQKVLALQQSAFDGIARALTQQSMAQMAQATDAALGQQPAERREALARESQADFKKYADEVFPILRDQARKLAPSTVGALLEEKLSEDELKQLAVMLDSPVYRKYQQLAPDFTRALTEKLVSESRAAVEPKITTLRDALRKRFAPPAGAATPAPGPGPGPAKPAASGAKK